MKNSVLSFSLAALGFSPFLQRNDAQVRAPAASPVPRIYPCFGSPLSEIGDADGDGVPDLLIADTNSIDGRVWLVSLGKKKALYSVPALPGDAELTTQIKSLGDVDGDGRPDWILGGTWRLPPPPSRTEPVRSNGALVYSGSTGKVLLRFSDEIPDQCLGCCVGGIGDFDHDGHADILLGAERVRRGTRESALAYVRSGKNGETVLAVGQQEPLGRIAQQVVGVGDVDADGTPDIGVVTGVAPASPPIALIFSGKTGEVLKRIPSANETVDTCLQPTGDLDGDGHADFLLGSTGFVRLLSGAKMSDLLKITSDQVRSATTTEPHCRFGCAVTCLRDRSSVHAGPTLVVSDPATNMWGGTIYFCSAVDGTEYARFGEAGANVKRTPEDSPAVEVHHLGCDLVNLGDVDGDGYEDVACGSENWTGGEDGQAFVLDGLTGNLLYELRRRGDDVVFLEPETPR